MANVIKPLYCLCVIIIFLLLAILHYVTHIDSILTEIQHRNKIAKLLEGVNDDSLSFRENVKRQLDVAVKLPEKEQKIEEMPPDEPPRPPGYKEFVMPKLKGENVISFSLWGGDRRYTIGAIRNAELAKEYFPGWKLRIYTEMPSDTPRYGVVSQDIINSAKEKGADIQFVDPFDTKVPPMMWRFLVADDMSVDRFIVRDIDSRLSARDAAAVYEWVKSDKPFQCSRDHPSHAGAAVGGGLWGGKPAALKDILRQSWEQMSSRYGTEYYQDMTFLIDFVWPKVKEHAYCSDSVSCDAWPNAHPFPVPRIGYEHVGQVFDPQDLGRPVDIRILRQTAVNKKCLPPS